MKYTLIAIFTWVAWTAFVYLLTAFVNVDLNFTDWGEFSRQMVAIFGATAGIAASYIAASYWIDKDRVK